ncbi:hypothetical protein G3N55_07385 [Dissulfurirhabdus thermomarina]|uniref:Uncharacterized protein n=1 Tax=Dissulfurirhabdus thermomarina TaxID=1765737 RepID=A0A6N9TMZ4_DISTH|nr:hypothetical protein [Dissulfurirhabdus thermomarina]NDY42662.1 hypothetical protein [Dissulfurirhabdus thermomarina]NMX23443.1 hypothetical protein [Dissulfurirhabdus thermomarina]
MRPRLFPAIILAALCLCLAGGCARISLLLQPTTMDRIDQWLEEDEYGLALLALERVKGTDPEAERLRARRPEIEARARAYEERVLREVKARLARDDWYGASEALDAALEKYPQGKRLEQADQDLRRRQEEKLGRLDDRLLLLRAEHLEKSLPVYRDIARVEAPPKNLKARWRARRIEFELAAIADQLLDRGLKRLRSGDLAAADEFLTLSARLKDTPAARQALARLRGIQAERARRVKLRVEKKTRKKKTRRIAETLEAARRALAAGDLVRARRLAEDLVTLGASGTAAEAFQADLEAATRRRVAELFREGSILYRGGHIEEAKARWEEVLRIDPDNSLARSHVERADRVLRKLQELRRRDKKGPPAPAEAPRGEAAP